MTQLVDDPIVVLTSAALGKYTSCEQLSVSNILKKAIRKLNSEDCESEPFAESADMEELLVLTEEAEEYAEQYAQEYPQIWDFVQFLAPIVRKGVFQTE